jgi:hypothetical protein
MSEDERLGADQLLRVLHPRIKADDKKVAGSMGSNCGDVAGRRSVMLTFIFCPTTGDIPDPRGGVIGVLWEKRIYIFFFE